MGFWLGIGLRVQRCSGSVDRILAQLSAGLEMQVVSIMWSLVFLLDYTPCAQESMMRVRCRVSEFGFSAGAGSSVVPLGLILMHLCKISR